MKAALVSNNAITAITPFVELLVKESSASSDARRSSAQQQLSLLYIQQTSGCTANEKWQTNFYSALKHSLEGDLPPTDENYTEICKAFLKLSYTMGNLSELTRHAGQMCSAQQCAEAFPLEWICKVYVEDSNGGEGVQAMLPSSIGSYADRLIALKPTSTLGMMTKAICLYEQNEILHAREMFLKGKCNVSTNYPFLMLNFSALFLVNQLQPNWNRCLTWLSKIYFSCSAWSLCEMLLRRMNQANEMLAQCLAEQEDATKHKEAIDLCKTLLPLADKPGQAQLLQILAL